MANPTKNDPGLSPSDNTAVTLEVLIGILISKGTFSAAEFAAAHVLPPGAATGLLARHGRRQTG